MVMEGKAKVEEEGKVMVSRGKGKDGKVTEN